MKRIRLDQLEFCNSRCYFEYLYLFGCSFTELGRIICHKDGSQFLAIW